MFEKIKKFYNQGLYNKTTVAVFVAKEKITEAEYAAITGEEYGG